MGYRKLGVACAVALATIAGGCAGPLVVSAAQSRGSNVKFGYTRMGSGEQGIISCDVPEGSGDVSNCRHMAINFKE
jgi:hypothetical protein